MSSCKTSYSPCLTLVKRIKIADNRQNGHCHCGREFQPSERRSTTSFSGYIQMGNPDQYACLNNFVEILS